MTDADLPAEEIPAPEEDFQEEYSGPRREPIWQLILGIVLFAGLLALVWDLVPRVSAKRTPSVPNSSSYLTTIQARQITYLVMALSYFGGEVKGTGELKHSTANYAEQAAGLWETAAQSTDDKKTRGKLLINAAALYGVADKNSSARLSLAEAKKVGGDVAATAGTLKPLYLDEKTPVKFTPAARRVIDSLSASPLIYARNAQSAGDSAAALRALQPGRDAGIRVIISIAIIFILMLGVLVAAIIIFALKFGPITRTLGRIDVFPAPAVNWGIGVALLLIVLPYLLSALASQILISALNITDMQTKLIFSSALLILAVVMELTIVLLALGRRPWEWSVFGWHAPRTTAGKGLLAIIIALPCIWLLSFISSVIFRDKVEIHQLIPTALSSHSWLLDLTLFLMVAVMAPFLEETLFRGILFRALDQQITFWVACFTNGVLFALVHGQVSAILPITGLGMLFGLLTRRYQSIWPSAIAHGVFNGFTMLITIITAWSLNGPGS